MEPCFRLEDVWVSAGEESSRHLLSSVTLEIPEGNRCTVVGRSGAGKSTLLRLLNRFVDPSRGRVLHRGVPLTGIPPGRLRQEVALVFQEPIWLPGTVRDNLLSPASLGVVGPAEAEDRLAEILELAGIEPALLDRDEDQLSVGQRQRVVLGRALMTRPRVLLLDEPTASLDPPGARALLGQVQRLAEAENLTLVMVTHRLQDAREFAPTTVVLDGGRVVEHGRSEDVLARLETKWDGF